MKNIGPAEFQLAKDANLDRILALLTLQLTELKYLIKTLQKRDISMHDIVLSHQASKSCLVDLYESEETVFKGAAFATLSQLSRAVSSDNPADNTLQFKDPENG